MNLNHINLAVTDVAKNREFFETYFGFECLLKQKANGSLAVLRDGNGLVLTLSNFDQAGEVHYPDSFHIGFMQESPERVDEINRRLKDDGYDVEAPRRFHGAWTFYFRAPGGFLIEVLC